MGLRATQIRGEAATRRDLMDIRMPLLDGIEATERIRKQGAPIPRILLLTTFDTPELVMEGMRRRCCRVSSRKIVVPRSYVPQCELLRVGRFFCKHPA